MKKIRVYFSLFAFVFGLAGAFAHQGANESLLDQAYGKNSENSCVLGNIITGATCSTTGNFSQCQVRVSNDPEPGTTDALAFNAVNCSQALNRISAP